MLFPLKPVIPFVPEQKFCPNCKAKLKVQKTREKDVFTLHIGVFRTHETVLHCQECLTFSNYGSEQLLDIVPERCQFGHDVMVYVGEAVFLRNRCNHEIMVELVARNIPISVGEIGYLAKKFIVYLAIVHGRNAGKIKDVMKLNGGFVLHLDATCDKGSPMLMSGIDSISDIVLGNIKIPSEKTEFIVPFLQKIKSLFGIPLAVVQDMGKGIMNAVKDVFPYTRIFICHFHFLRDIGKDLFGTDYDVIRKRLQKHAISSKLHKQKKELKMVIDNNPALIDGIYYCVEKGTIEDSLLELMPLVSCYALIMWILEGRNQGDGYGFPFDSVHFDFSQRLLIGYKKLEELKLLELRGNWKDNKPFYKLSCTLSKIANDNTLKCALSNIQPKIEVFDKLRCAMRIAEHAGKKGLNDDAIVEDIRTIEKKVYEFRSYFVKNKKLSENKDYYGFIAQLDKYWEKLFADPIEVSTPTGKIIIQPQRTNNIIERFFRDFKRNNIKKTGNNSIGKTIKAILAETPLVKNLCNPEYMKVILGSNNSLAEVFREVDVTIVRQSLKDSKITDDTIPKKIKKIIDKKRLPEIIIDSFRTRLGV